MLLRSNFRGPKCKLPSSVEVRLNGSGLADLGRVFGSQMRVAGYFGSDPGRDRDLGVLRSGLGTSVPGSVGHFIKHLGGVGEWRLPRRFQGLRRPVSRLQLIQDHPEFEPKPRFARKTNRIDGI